MKDLLKSIKISWLVFLIMALLVSLLLIQLSRYSLINNSLLLEWILVFVFFGIILLAFYLGWKSLRKKQGIGKNQKVLEILTEREKEILNLMAKGYSNKEIGDVLFIAESTVKKHSSNIFEKLEVKRRTQAIHKAFQAGVLQK